MRKHWKRALWLTACIGSAIAALGPAADSQSKHGAQPAPSHISESSAPVGSPVALPARQLVGTPRVDLFAPRMWTASPPPAPSAQASEAPAAPAPPALPYRFAGTVEHDGKLRIVLAAGDRVHLVNVGDVIDELYVVREVTRDTATLVYTPLGTEQQVAYASQTAFSPPSSIGAPVPVVAEERRASAMNAASPAAPLLPPGSPIAAR